MEITATRYTREDGVHIVLTKAGWLVLCQKGPMRIWTGSRSQEAEKGEGWEVLFKYETDELDKFAYPKDPAMAILEIIKRPSSRDGNGK